tara:strand:+ start:59528 stop:60826 length:1299 start_codon:yes stop_codon:yes gene_type:complete
MPIVEWDEYTGRLDAIDSVEVRARVSGYLGTTHFHEGQMVEKGDLLAIIDPRPFRAELNGAKARLEEATARLSEAHSLKKQALAEKADSDAQLNLANSRLERAMKLLESNAISKDEVDVIESEQLQAAAAIEAANAKVESANAGIATATAAIETAKANVETASLNLQYTQVRAPVGGRISRRYVTEGNLISGGSNQSTLLTTIVSTSPIHCYFDANEQDFLKYVRLAREGKRESSRDVKNPVFLALVDEEGYPHTGHMDFVDNQIDPNTGTMRGRAILANEDGLLTPGLFARVRLPGSGRYDAVLIPDSAIGSDQSEKFVYAVGEDGSVERKKITPGPLSHGLRVIRAGLDGSERIVTRGLQQIRPGVTVKPTEETIEAVKDKDLPDEYKPVPKDEWLSRQPAEVPTDVESNAEPYKEPSNGTPNQPERSES